MIDLQFYHAEASRHGQCRHERVKRADWNEGPTNLATKGFQGAACVSDSIMQNPLPDRIGNPRHPSAEPAVLPFGPHASHHVGVSCVQNMQQPGDVSRVILPISIHGEKSLPLRFSQSIKQRCRLTPVFIKGKHSQGGPSLRQGRRLQASGILAAIVHSDDFIGASQRFHGQTGLGEYGLDTFFLIIKGNN
ncbi:hypothetical protein GCM10023213_28280 [Prosthecobacter algae]|uniref:Uncharacterized protein n=1 Tax=Prosthecobacter algae TaxID=1144682 RepID=A0ABP9P8I2_9BACT